MRALAALLLLVTPLQAAECGFLTADHEAALSIDEEASPQTVTIDRDGEEAVCTLLPAMTDTTIMLCPRGPVAIQFLNESDGPTVFVVRGETYTWFCPAENGVELQPAFNVDAGE